MQLHREDGWNVFWDRDIEAGSHWSDELQRRLDSARCVIVLWSRTSRESFWVHGEAARAFERDVYLPVSLDDSHPPRLFSSAQTLSISRWARGGGTADLTALREAVRSRVGNFEMTSNLERVADAEPVTDAHLHLVHSCWRVDKETAFGLMPFQIHLVVFGHHTATSRIESVEYHLPGYPEGHQRQSGGPPERLFELKELANGFCVAQAHVRLRDQPPGHPKVIRLARLVNMSERGPRLLDDLLRRTEEGSRLKRILIGLPAAEAEAARLIETLPAETVVQRLTTEGYPPAMAEAAVATAESKRARKSP